jgi:signal transduction histidine kinase
MRRPLAGPAFGADKRRRWLEFRLGWAELERGVQWGIRTIPAMLVSHPGCSHRAARGKAGRTITTLAPALLPTLGGCTSGSGGNGAWIFASLALLMASGGAYLFGTLRERRRGEQALRAAHAALRNSQQIETGWSWQTDAEHRLVGWRGPGPSSAASCPLFGADRGSVDLRARLAHQQAFSAQRVAAERALEGSVGWELGGVPCFDDLGRFSGFVGSARPTDADDALLAAASALPPALAVSAAATVVALNHGPGWCALQFNDAAQQLWPSLRAGAPLDGLLADLPAPVRQACSQAQPGAAVELQGWRLGGFGPLADGARGLVLVQPVQAKDGVTAQETENFSFTVSHDLRAPIRVVEGFTRIVKEDYGRLLDRVGNDHLDRVLGAATRMNLMIDALLTLARLSSQPLARQPVNLSQLAGYVIDDLRRTAPEREADVEIEPGLTAVGDPTLLRMVLENLIGNAWKYSGRCSRAQISLHQLPHGARTAFVVRDNGAGFDMRSADRLFGLFQRLHSASEFPGHGVGLASVRRIVRRHGGELWAEAEPGRGAAFFFTLAG